jgi:ribosome biogenesis GTPase
VAAVEAVAAGVAVHATSALVAGGLDGLRPYLRSGQTVALVGSAGVGKSTIVNRLAGRELIPVQEIRPDDRGRHTTTARQLVRLPDGAMLLDTPGMRTVLMWEGEDGLAQTFADVETLAARCRFDDCTHVSEPGCAVREAIERGMLDSGRLSSYLKLQREVRHQARKSDQRLRQAEQKRWRRLSLEMRRRPDKRGLRP